MQTTMLKSLLAVSLLATPLAAQESPAPAAPPADPPVVEDTSVVDELIEATVGEDDGGAAQGAAEGGAGEDAPRLAPVVVTARKWDEVLQEVPMSVTAIDLGDVISAGVPDVRDAVESVPNLYMSEFTSRRLSFPFLRGIGSGQGDPAVNTYIDGVPQLTTSSTNIPLLDVDRIEFLRGPQGTLYGRNALGGLINIKTRPPEGRFRIRYQGSLGNYDLREHAFGVNVRAGEAAIGITSMSSKRDGYTDNSFTGKGVDFRDTDFMRGQVVLTPTDEDEFRFSVHDERSRDGGFALYDVAALRDKSHTISQDFDGRAHRDVLGTGLTWTHSGESVDFTSVTGYSDWRIKESADFDFTAFDGVRRFTNESQDYISQELRVGSAEGAELELGDELRMRWLLGMQLFSSDSARAARNDFRPAGAGILFPPTSVGSDRNAGDFDDIGLAGFGQAVFTWNDSIDLTVGMRYDYEDKKADTSHTFTSGGIVFVNESASFDESYDEWLPEVGLAWRPSDAATIYGRAAKAFKAGGFNLSAPAGSESFDPEEAWTYEVGAKTTWLEDRLQVNGAFFFIDWDDMQLSQFDAQRGGYVQNAGSSESYGFELEAVAVVADGFEVFSTFGIVETEIDEYTDSFGTDTSGNDLPFAPETTFSLGARVGGELGGSWRWYAGAEYVNLGDFHFDAGNRESESYDLAHFRAGLSRGRLRLEGWMRNAFDEEYIAVAFQPNPADPTAFVGENGAPQTYGISLSIGF